MAWKQRVGKETLQRSNYAKRGFVLNKSVSSKRDLKKGPDDITSTLRYTYNINDKV